MVAKLTGKKQGPPASKPAGQNGTQGKKIETPASQAKAKGGSAHIGGTIGNTKPS